MTSSSSKARTRPRPLGRLIPVLVVGAFMVVSCGDSDDDDSASPAGESPDVSGSQDVCEAASADGGEVNFYSSISLERSPAIFAAFSEEYPDIHIEQTRASGDELIRRMLTEISSGNTRADILETNAQNVAQVILEGVTENYVIPTAVGIPDEFKDPDGAWTGTRRRPDVIAYNTDLLSAEEAPQRYEELTDPKWNGEIIIESTNVTDFTVIRHRLFDGDLDRTKEYFEQIAANDPFLSTGSQQTIELLAAGQGSIMLGAPGQDVVDLKNQGAPVDYTRTEAVLDTAVATLIKDGPNPNGAKCFLNWFVTPAGQQAILDAGYIPASEEVEAGPDLRPPDMEVYLYTPELAETYDEDLAAWNEVFNLR